MILKETRKKKGYVGEEIERLRGRGDVRKTAKRTTRTGTEYRNGRRSGADRRSSHYSGGQKNGKCAELSIMQESGFIALKITCFECSDKLRSTL